MLIKRIALFCLIAGSLFSCTNTSDDESIEIIETNFNEEVPLGFSFEFVFNQNIVSDTLLNNWKESSIIEFEPIIEGRYFWKHTNVLVFSPNAYLQPATSYKALLKKDLFNDGLKVKERSFDFHTPWLKIEKTENYWDTRDGSNQAQLHGIIHFNYNVEAKSLEGKLDAIVDEEKQTAEIISIGSSKSITYVLPNVSLEDKDRTGEIKIAKSIMPAVGGSSWKEDKVHQITVSSPFKLSITDIESNHDGTNGTITVATSQNVNLSGIKDFIEISPKIKYEVQSGNNNFSIRSSDFDIKKKYTIVLKKGIKGLLGGELKNDEQRDLSFGELEPSIKFLNKKNLYLSANGNRNIEVSIINVDKVKLEIFKVYENNLLDYMAGGNYYYDDYYYDDYYRGDNSYLGNKGDKIFEESIQTKSLEIKGNKRILNFKFKDKIKDYDGLYLVKLSSDEQQWINAAKMVALSDLGLIVKEGKESVSVFVNSLETAQPIGGVELNLIGRNNQVIKTKKTDANGVAVISRYKKDLSGFRPQLISARYNDDFNFIHLGKTEIDKSRFDVGGMRSNETGWMAYIYQERDLYRPGEKAHLSAIVRDFNWNTPEPVPMIMKIYSPDGQEYKTIKKTLDKEGALEASIDFPVDAMTGGYSVNLLTSNEVHLQSSYIKVEEFVPDRIKVNTSINAEEFQQGDTIGVNIYAENMFGPPASDRNYEVQMNLNRSYFHSEDYRGYNFSLSNNNNSFDNRIEKGKTDAEGKAKATFAIPSIYKNMGKLRATLNTTVFDETGRPVNRINSATIYTQDVFFGIDGGSYYRKVNRESSVSIVGVDKEGKIKPGSKAEVKFIRHEYRTVLSKSGRYFRYRSQHQEKLIDTKTIEIGNSPKDYRFTPDISGRYEIRVSIPGSNMYVSRNFYCYGYGRTNSNSFQVNNEGKIDIVPDKENYTVGESAKILMKTPFSGKVLVTVESDELVQYFYQNTDSKALAFDLDITKDMLPNVYITATLFRPHEQSELPLTVAHGFVPIKVDDPKREIKVLIEAPEKSRSNSKQTIKVKGAPNSQMTIAAVDEGILQVSGFETPKPYQYFYQKRALEVNSYNIYPFLFPEVALSSGRPGGGGALKKRINPMTNKRFELVSFWSGILKTNSEGYAEMEINIPQFSGEIRIMAVDYKSNSFGSASKSMKIADPVVISPGIPRFLSPRDTVEAIFTLSNTTEDIANAKANLALTGPMKVIGSSRIDTKIDGKKEARIKYQIAVEPSIGTGTIALNVDALGESFSNKTNISIRPASPLQKRSGSGIIEANKTTTISLETHNFMEKSVGRKLILGTSPLIEFRKDLDYLIQYPHGCLEQTTSRAFPQIYLDDILKEVMGDEFEESQARRNVQAAIEKLKTMQLYNGGFTYWSGMGRENWWASTYATHFLVEAKKAGYQVEDDFLNPALEYLNSRLKSKEKVDYWYNGNLNRKIAPKTVAYALYVLAMAEQPNKSTMNYYKAHREDLSLDSHYLLAAAYRMIGDEKSYRDLLPGTFEGEIANSVFGGTFHSYIRDEAIALNALLEADDSDPQIPNMARHIAQQLKDKRWLNTQERSFSLLALGKISKANANNNISAEISVNGIRIDQFNKRTKILKDGQLNEDAIQISTEGSGNLYYFWETEGIDKTGAYKEEDNFLAVRKTMYTREGREIRNNKVKQNDMVIVKISIRSLQNNTVENVAITDILPAGLEIENPRLKNVPGVNWIKKKSYPEYMDIRDDRITYFVTANGAYKHYYYMARAVSPGTYQMGPVGADAMYNGEYHSYSGGGTLIVEE